MLVKVTYEVIEQIYRVSWSHSRSVDGRMVTSCNITNIESGKVILSGTAICSLKDQFDRNFGRKLSLSRALSSIIRRVRIEFWKAYFSRSQKPKDKEILAAIVAQEGSERKEVKHDEGA